MQKTVLAFDKSLRSLDANGNLHVEVSHISKAMVCPYMGSEIPGADVLGLDADKIYMLLRDPTELAAAAATFRNLPLLSHHIPISADAPRPDLVVGSTGSDTEYTAPYLDVSLSVWDAAAIAGINSGQQTELSSAYRYRADMTPGVYEGTKFDGVMRDIVGNHVALVETGRAGPDVVVADSNPFKGNTEMTKAQRLIAAKAGARTALAGLLIAQDADLSLLDKLLAKLAMDADDDKDDKGDDKKKPALDEGDDDEEEDDPDAPGQKRKKVKPAMDAEEDEPKKPEVTKAAMDAAIAKAVTAATVKVRAEAEALHTARKDVASEVGDVALDSAEAVYKFALDQAKVDVTGVDPSAYRALFKLASAKAEPAPRIALDSAVVAGVAERFPALARF